MSSITSVSTLKKLIVILGRENLQKDSQLYKDLFQSIDRKEIIKHYLKSLPNEQEVYLFGRSAGAILATQLADSFQIKKVICLGYPFKHPEKAEESYRTEHLAKLKTQTIIFQGKQDPYGNLELGKQFCISEKIKIIEVATDHEFVRAPETLKLIQTFIYKELLSS